MLNVALLDCVINENHCSEDWGRGICPRFSSPSCGIWQFKCPSPQKFTIQGKKWIWRMHYAEVPLFLFAKCAKFSAFSPILLHQHNQAITRPYKNNILDKDYIGLGGTSVLVHSDLYSDPWNVIGKITCPQPSPQGFSVELHFSGNSLYYWCHFTSWYRKCFPNLVNASWFYKIRISSQLETKKWNIWMNINHLLKYSIFFLKNVGMWTIVYLNSIRVRRKFFFPSICHCLVDVSQVKDNFRNLLWWHHSLWCHTT